MSKGGKFTVSVSFGSVSGTGSESLSVMYCTPVVDNLWVKTGSLETTAGTPLGVGGIMCSACKSGVTTVVFSSSEGKSNDL